MDWVTSVTLQVYFSLFFSLFSSISCFSPYFTCNSHWDSVIVLTLVTFLDFAIVSCFQYDFVHLYSCSF